MHCYFRHQVASKVEQIFKLFIQCNTEKKCQFRCGIELTCFDGTDCVPRNANHIRQLTPPLVNICVTKKRVVKAILTTTVLLIACFKNSCSYTSLFIMEISKLDCPVFLAHLHYQSIGGAYDNVCTTTLNLKWYIAGENI